MNPCLCASPAAGLQPGKGSESDTSQTDAGDALEYVLHFELLSSRFSWIIPHVGPGSC